MAALLGSELLAAVLRVADAQSGLVTHRQLLSRGVGRDTVGRLRKRGWLRPVHTGVYLVGAAQLPERARLRAAVLACTPDAYIAKTSALGWVGVHSPDKDDPVHVTVIGRACRSKSGLIVHRGDSIDPGDLGSYHGIPIVLTARSLLDAAPDLETQELVDAVDEAIARHLVDRAALERVIKRYPGHRGAAILREVVDPGRVSDFSKVKAQKRLTRLLNKAKAPRWESEYVIGPFRPDFVWPELKLVIEVDGEVHADSKRREEDQERSDWLRYRGWVVVRFTNRQIFNEPEFVLLRVGQELGRLMLTAQAA